MSTIYRNEANLPWNSQRDFAGAPTPAARTPKGRSKPPRGGRSSARRWFAWIMTLTLLGLVFAIIGYWGLVFYYEHRLPEVFRTEDYLAETLQVNRIVSAEGDVLYEYGDQRRSVVPEERIPGVIKNAVLAAEDADFIDTMG